MANIINQNDSSYPLHKMIGGGGRNAQSNAQVLPIESAAGKMPPHSNEAEMAVLGAMMLDRSAIAKVVEILEVDSFYRESHRKMYEVMLNMFERGISADYITLAEELRRRGLLEFIGGVYYLTEINNNTPTAANIEHHARIVQERFLKRSLINTASKIVQNCYDDTTDALEEIDRAEASIFEIAEKRLRRSYTGMNKLAKDAFNMIVKMTEQGDGDGLSGVPSGFARLDDMLGGFQKSDLIIIAARPSMGKTALALSIVRNVALEYKMPVAFFSIEMASIQLVIRLLSAESRINAHDIRTGKLSGNSLPQIVQTIGRLAEAPIFIDDSPTLSIMEMRAKCRRLKSEHDIKLVVVDYLQLIHSPKAESREREISMISRSLKQIAKELDIAVIALAQLNRSVESRADKRPMLSDLRESGSIEQDADVVMFINRPEYYGITTYEDGSPTQGTAEIIVGKQRNGPVGDARVAYLKDFARFENLSFQYDEPPPYMDGFDQLDSASPF